MPMLVTLNVRLRFQWASVKGKPTALATVIDGASAKCPGLPLQFFRDDDGRIQVDPMNQSTRKFLGTVLTLIILVVYSWLAMLIYERFLTGAPPLVLLAYFIVAGLSWAIPISFIIRWMARPDRA
jgi:hypothetical protein